MARTPIVFRCLLPLMLTLAMTMDAHAAPPTSGAVHGDGVIPPATELPQMLPIEDALRIFRTRGLDLLIADAATRNAEGAVKIAGAMYNLESAAVDFLPSIPSP